MSSGEDYLDSLLASAINQESKNEENNEEKTPSVLENGADTDASSSIDSKSENNSEADELMALLMEETPDVTETTDVTETPEVSEIPETTKVSEASEKKAEQENLDIRNEENEAETENVDTIDIEEQLAKAAELQTSPEKELPSEEKELADLLAEVDGDEDLADISDLLQKSDQNELVDENLIEPKDLAEVQDLPVGDDSSDNEKAIDSENLSSNLNETLLGENTEDGSDFDSPEKSKKKKKKGSFFSKLFHAITEDVEEETIAVPEKDSTKISEENLDILSAIDAEKNTENAEESNPKKKKEKKPKKEKKEKKEKKAKKPKKVKKEKLAPMPDDTKKVPKKYVVRTFFVAFSLLVAILVVIRFIPNLLLLKDARDAYYQQDYKEAFLALYGKNLSESDQLIYDRAKLIVLMQRKLESYQNYQQMGMNEEALNALLQGLDRYQLLATRAEELGISEDLNKLKNEILDELMEQYGISEEEAIEILSYDSLDYTNRIESIINGTPFVRAAETFGLQTQTVSDSSEDETAQDLNEEMELPDLLPEEEEYLNQENTGTSVNEENSEEESGEEQIIPEDGVEVEIQIESDQF